MKSAQNVRKILFIAPGGIGNLVLAIPALRSLKQGYPQAAITLLTAEVGIERVLDGEGLVADVICCERGILSDLCRAWSRIRILRTEKFDVGMTAGTVNPFSAGLLMWLSGIPVRAGENIKRAGLFYTVKAPYAVPCHETAGALNIVKALGLEADLAVPQLIISDEEARQTEIFLRHHGWNAADKLIGLHPGASLSAGQSRRWPKENFIKVMQALHAGGARLLVVAGPAERELAEEIVQSAGVPVINTRAELSLRQTAAVIQRCRQFISNDSGVAHIAAAVGVPLVVLFGSTDPSRTAPRGSSVKVLKTPQAEPVSCITVEEVLNCL